MEGKNYLGVYLSKEAATVACLNWQAKGSKVLGCFSVTTEAAYQDDANSAITELVRSIEKGCAERKFEFSEVAVALDCSMFMQHSLHSEFNDPKQIAQTIRFDTEEAIATDIGNFAIAFKITQGRQSGAELDVFTVERKILSEILLALQNGNFDPVTVEPDVNCLARFITKNLSLAEDLHPFFGILSYRNGYLIVPPKTGTAKRSTMRTFLVGPRQDRSKLLAREVLLTSALAETDEPIDSLKIFDSTNSIDYHQLSEKAGIEASSMDLGESASVETPELVDCADTVEFAIAYGAALALLEKEQSINFRSDFMPYQGKKKRTQSAVKFLSISVTILLLALGVYTQLQLLQKNKPRKLLREKFAKQYSIVMSGKTLPTKSKEAKGKLDRELRRIHNVQKGLLSATGEKSLSAKLTLVLGAFNSCASQTNLSIDSVSITAKIITLVGSTSRRSNTLKLRKAIEDNDLIIQQDRLEEKGGRDNFTITVIPKK